MGYIVVWDADAEGAPTVGGLHQHLYETPERSRGVGLEREGNTDNGDAQRDILGTIKLKG